MREDEGTTCISRRPLIFGSYREVSESDSIMPLKDGSSEDYQAAAVRHYEDATMLRDAGRLDNAGHLIGFSAECAIKHRIGALGTEERSPAQHLPEILVAARKRLGERSNFASMFNLLKSGIFSDWAVDHRYSPTGKATSEQLAAWFLITRRLLAAANIRVRSA